MRRRHRGVDVASEGECDGELNLSDPGPFGVGIHDIEVTDEIGTQLDDDAGVL